LSLLLLPLHPHLLRPPTPLHLLLLRLPTPLHLLLLLLPTPLLLRPLPSKRISLAITWRGAR
jgi:hypothetical protein